MEGPRSTRMESAPSEADKLIESWKLGPVILASGSTHKLSELKELGMSHAEALSTPEEIETEIFERFEDNKGHVDERVSMWLAHAKVKHVVEQGVPEKALVCGFDTIVIKTERGEGRKVREYLQKPESREEAKENLSSFFEHLALEHRRLNNGSHRFFDAARNLGQEKLMRDMLTHGTPQALILITTGMAARLPGNGNVIHWDFAHIRLKPNAVYELSGLSDEDLHDGVTNLAEQALSMMDEGEKWKKITTGIDYADPRIQALLGLEESIPYPEMDATEEGVMTGMPRQAFEKFLRNLAEEKLSKREPEAEAAL